MLFNSMSLTQEDINLREGFKKLKEVHQKRVEDEIKIIFEGENLNGIHDFTIRFWKMVGKYYQLDRKHSGSKNEIKSKIKKFMKAMEILEGCLENLEGEIYVESEYFLKGLYCYTENADEHPRNLKAQVALYKDAIKMMENDLKEFGKVKQPFKYDLIREIAGEYQFYFDKKPAKSTATNKDGKQATFFAIVNEAFKLIYSTEVNSTTLIDGISYWEGSKDLNHPEWLKDY